MPQFMARDVTDVVRRTLSRVRPRRSDVRPRQEERRRTLCGFCWGYLLPPLTQLQGGRNFPRSDLTGLENLGEATWVVSQSR